MYGTTERHSVRPMQQELSQVEIPQETFFPPFFKGFLYICRGYGRMNFDAYVCNNALCELVQCYWVPHCKLQKLSEAYKSGQNREIMALRAQHGSPPLGPQPTRPLLPFPLFFVISKIFSIFFPLFWGDFFKTYM